MTTKNYHWYALDVDRVAEVLKTNIEKGLDGKEVEIRQRFGYNKLPEEKPVSRIKIFLFQLKSPLIYILAVAGIITLVLREYTDSLVIFGAVFLNTTVGYFQEFKASNTLRALKKILKVKAIVLRDGKEKQILQENLVAGDIIILKSGHKVPADARIVSCLNLKVNESSLTGEWLSSEKKEVVLKKNTSLAERSNMVFMGTVVEEGEAKAIVVRVGKKTEIGKVAGMLKEQKEEKTPYQKKITHFSKILGVIITLICVFIFIEGILFQRDFIEMFVTSVAVAVAAIPEGLPIAMTVILALGMQRILKKKGLVRNLYSAETLGSTSVIATDKTLTLTEGKMEACEFIGFDKKLIQTIACLANEAIVENPKEKLKKWKIIGRPTDKALIEGAQGGGVLQPELLKQFPRIGEIGFNTENKFIASLHQKKGDNIMYVSGAPEKIIELSSKLKGKTQTKINKKTIEHLTDQLNNLTSKGLRVVAFAYKNIKKDEITKEDVKGLIFAGFIGLKDPVRKEAKKAMAICQKAGMKVVMVTGDHLLTAKSVARELNLRTKKENVMIGKELDELSEEQLSKRLNHIDVFARVEPKHKLRIIAAWQKKHHVVAMTGDGINDAPALKKADIGVSLGSGTDVAKEASDLVLLDDNFSVIVSAIEEGRAILDNIRKVITYILSDSFSEVVLISVGIVLRVPLAVTAVQILWINLIEDGLPNIALAFEPKEKDLMQQKPQNHKHPLLTREMKVIIFAIGVLTDLVLLGLFFWLLNKHGETNIDYIRTMMFVALTIDSLFYVFSCKSLRKNIWRINILSNKLLLISFLLGGIALFGAIYIPVLQNLLQTVSLGFFDILLLIGFGILNSLLIESVKYYFIARHETNL